MKENLGIFDWSLTQEELNQISEIPQRKLIYLAGFVVTEPNRVTAEIDSKLWINNVIMIITVGLENDFAKIIFLNIDTI